VAQGPGKRQPPPQVVALILLICTITGLIAGAGTRQLVTSLVLRGIGTPSSIGAQGTSTGSLGNSATVLPDPSPTIAGTLPPSLPDKLQVQVSPASVSQGQQFTITVTVLAKDGTTPIEGVPCSIAAATVGGVQLFTDWPPAVVSNAQGLATWTLQAPDVTPGRYSVKITATASDGYYVYVVEYIVIS
jgi:hypothetical protein